MLDLGIDINASFQEFGAWFIFFTDGSGGLWYNGKFRLGKNVDERGN